MDVILSFYMLIFQVYPAYFVHHIVNFIDLHQMRPFGVIGRNFVLLSYSTLKIALSLINWRNIAMGIYFARRSWHRSLHLINSKTTRVCHILLFLIFLLCPLNFMWYGSNIFRWIEECTLGFEVIIY